jgi:hypothetical protein
MQRHNYQRFRLSLIIRLMFGPRLMLRLRLRFELVLDTSNIVN